MQLGVLALRLYVYNASCPLAGKLLLGPHPKIPYCTPRGGIVLYCKSLHLAVLALRLYCTVCLQSILPGAIPSPCSLPTHSVQYQVHFSRFSSQNQLHRSRGGADGFVGQGCALQGGTLLFWLAAGAPPLLEAAGPWLAAAGAGPWLAAAANNSSSALYL